MKSSAAKAKQEAPSRDRSQVLPAELREVIAKTRYEAPKVISFPFDQTKAKTNLLQVTMMGSNF
jgi:hypothetical protein